MNSERLRSVSLWNLAPQVFEFFLFSSYSSQMIHVAIEDPSSAYPVAARSSLRGSHFVVLARTQARHIRIFELPRDVRQLTMNPRPSTNSLYFRFIIYARDIDLAILRFGGLSKVVQITLTERLHHSDTYKHLNNSSLFSVFLPILEIFPSAQQVYMGSVILILRRLLSGSDSSATEEPRRQKCPDLTHITDRYGEVFKL